VRTPKYRVARREKSPRPPSYRKRLKLTPWIELIVACYFFHSDSLSLITNHNYFTAPFLILFVIGYWYTRLMSCCKAA